MLPRGGCPHHPLAVGGRENSGPSAAVKVEPPAGGPRLQDQSGGSAKRRDEAAVGDLDGEHGPHTLPPTSTARGLGAAHAPLSLMQGNRKRRRNWPKPTSGSAQRTRLIMRCELWYQVADALTDTARSWTECGGGVMGKEGRNLGERWGRIEALLEQADSTDYETTRLRLRVARELFHDELAARLQGAFERRLEVASLNVKDATISLNADLRLLGLALECPVTHQPSVLCASLQDGPRMFHQLVESDPPRRKTAVVNASHSPRLIGFPDRGDRSRTRSP